VRSCASVSDRTRGTPQVRSSSDVVRAGYIRNDHHTRRFGRRGTEWFKTLPLENSL
jgi:hypothetical protein